MAKETTKKMVTLTSSDGREFVVSEVAARESQTIRDMMDDDFVITSIPLPNVDPKTLAKVMEYCLKHAEEAEKAADVLEDQTEGSSSSAPAAPEAS